MRPTRMYASGFQGIRHGLGIDEIEVDLSGLEGVVALTGDNGRGKSTFLGLLQPWPWLPDHGNDLYRQVAGPAVKELEFTAGGERWRSVIEVNPARRRTRARLLVWKGGDAWLPAEVDGIRSTGTLKSYLALLERIVCPPELFFRAAFRSQAARPLASLSPAEAKSVFVAALDLPRIEAIGRRATRVRNALTDRAAVLDEQVSGLEKEIEGLRGRADRAAELEAAVSAQEEALHRAGEEHRRALERLARAEAEIAAMGEARRRAAEIHDRLREARRRRSESISLRRRLEAEVEERSEAVRKRMDEAATLLARRREIERAAAERERLEAIRRKAIERAAGLDRSRRELTELEGKLAEVRSRMRYLERRGRDLRRASETLGRVPCRDEVGGTCPLLDEARRAVAELEELRSEYRALRTEIRTGEARVGELRRRYAIRQEAAREAERLGAEIDGLRETAALLPSLEAAARVLEEGRASLDQIRRDHARRVEEIEREAARLSREIESLERESADLERTVPDPEPIRREVERTAATVKEIEGRLSVLREELATARAARDMLEERLASLKELRSRSSRLHRRAATFSLLAKAFSKDGIVALEIEDVGPALTAEANALLRECMEGRFAINVRLQVNTADGNGTRETFEILVHDSRSPDGEPKLLNDLSGGEAAVVEPAVVHALALLDAARAGGRLEAAFCDEILSRLSPWNRLEAFEAFRRFHRRGRFRVSFLVTHEEEVWSRCDHVLRFEEGGIRGLN